MKAKAKATIPNNLPFGIIAKDLEYPSYKSKDRLVYNDNLHGSITLYEIENVRGGDTFWVVTTLGISRASTRSGRPRYADRTYGVRCDTGGVVRVGKGPHVKQEVRVYIRQSREKTLAKLIEAYTKGLAQAGQIRDTISTRRAQGALRRAGRPDWMF